MKGGTLYYSICTLFILFGDLCSGAYQERQCKTEYR